MSGVTTRDIATIDSRDGFSGIEDHVWVSKRQDGQQQGLSDRDLLYPKYAIHNKAAYEDDWNADKGGISNKTVNTDLIHQNGLTMYDVSCPASPMLDSSSHLLINAVGAALPFEFTT